MAQTVAKIFPSLQESFHRLGHCDPYSVDRRIHNTAQSLHLGSKTQTQNLHFGPLGHFCSVACCHKPQSKITEVPSRNKDKIDY